MYVDEMNDHEDKIEYLLEMVDLMRRRLDCHDEMLSLLHKDIEQHYKMFKITADALNVANKYIDTIAKKK